MFGTPFYTSNLEDHKNNERLSLEINWFGGGCMFVRKDDQGAGNKRENGIGA